MVVEGFIAPDNIKKRAFFIVNYEAWKITVWPTFIAAGSRSHKDRKPS
jgi:hypothetical protein